MNWKVAPRFESANLLITQLRLGLRVRQEVRSGSYERIRGADFLADGMNFSVIMAFVVNTRSGTCRNSSDWLNASTEPLQKELRQLSRRHAASPAPGAANHYMETQLNSFLLVLLYIFLIFECFIRRFNRDLLFTNSNLDRDPSGCFTCKS